MNFVNTGLGSTTADFTFDILPWATNYIGYNQWYYISESLDWNTNTLNISDLLPNTTYMISINAKDIWGGFSTRQEATITTTP
jgi:hypothetical protein